MTPSMYFSFSYLVCKMRVSYYIVICGLSCSMKFFHVFLQTVSISGKKFLSTKYVLIFSTISI